MADTQTKLPSIPDVSSIPDISTPLRTTLAAIILTLNVLLGRTKASPDDQLVTRRDLNANDTVKRYVSSAVTAATTPSASSVVVVQNNSEGTLIDTTTPPSLQNVVVTSTPTSVIASFSLPTYANQYTGLSNHAYTMLYMVDANADGSSPGFGSAIASGQSNGPVIYLPVGGGRHVYVWLRNVSKADVVGPLYGGATGIEITTPVSLNIVDSLLAIEPQSPFKVLSAPVTINGVTYPAGVYIKGAYVDEIDALIAKFGEASIDQAKIGTLSASKIDTTTINATFAKAVTAQFEDVSAAIANLGDVNTKGWITATGKGTAWGGLRSSVAKGWQTDVSGFIFGINSLSQSFMEFRGGYSFIRMCSWGDNSIQFADNAGNVKFSVDNAGNAFFAGRLGNTVGGYLVSNDGQSWIDLNTSGSDWLLVAGGRGLIRANGSTSFNNTIAVIGTAVSGEYKSFNGIDYGYDRFNDFGSYILETGVYVSADEMQSATYTASVWGWDTSVYDSGGNHFTVTYENMQNSPLRVMGDASVCFWQVTNSLWQVIVKVNMFINPHQNGTYEISSIQITAIGFSVKRIT